MSARKKPRRNTRQANARKSSKKPVAWAAGTLLGVVGLVVAVLSFGVGLTGPISDIVETKSEPELLEVKAIDDGGVSRYVLPLDARLEDMPYEVSPGCSPKMHEWLRANGKPLPKFYRMTVRNKAAAGSMLTIDNVRVRDQEDKDPEPAIVFDCPSAGLGDTAVLNLHLDREGPAMLLDEQTDKERPFTFNLEPGEQGNIELRMSDDSGRTRSGEVIVDVTSGDKTVAVPLKLGSDGRFARLGTGRNNGLIIMAGDRQGDFDCIVNINSNQPDIEGCTADQVRQKARASARPGFGRPFATDLSGNRTLTTDASGKRLELLVGGKQVSSVTFDDMGITDAHPQSGVCSGSLCVVGVGVGAHSTRAVLIRVDGDRISVLDAQNATSESDELKVIDITGDGVPEMLGKVTVGVYAEGRRRWITWEVRDDKLVSTGCGPVDGPEPDELQEGPCV